MRILYIGPYKENSIFGSTSRNHILSLTHQKCSVSIKPIYRDTKLSTINTPSLNSLEASTHDSSDYDIIIQYADMHQLLPMTDISHKNYAIPIISYKYISEHTKNNDYKILHYFDSIFFDSETDFSLVKKNLSNSKNNFIKLFEHIDMSDQEPDIHYNIFNNKYKFYTFIDNSSAKHLSKIVESFLGIKKKINTCILFLVCENDTISKHVELILDKMKPEYVYCHNYIKILHLSHDSLQAHKLCDGLIEYKEYTNSGVQIHNAKVCGNGYIVNEPIKKNTLMNFADFDTYWFTDKIKNMIGTSPIYDNNISSLGSILCK